MSDIRGEVSDIKGREVTIAFDIPEMMTPDAEWPYMFSVMFTHFDNDCRWGSGSSPTYSKIIALKSLKAVCDANIEYLEQTCQ